jgi:prephenate dehydratase
MTTVACYGSEGSFSYLAALSHFGDTATIVCTARFEDVFSLVTEERADAGVIPIENSLAGSVYENYDLLSRYSLTITGEHFLPISHHLLALPTKGDGDRLSMIRRVYSHPKALEQCLSFFRDHPHLEQVAFADTAVAAKHIRDARDPTLAAIASESAAEIYGLHVVRRHLEDDSHNVTRFVVVSREFGELDKADKCSILFTLQHRPGTLLEVLEILNRDRANLTKIESRPIHGKQFEYRFYVDFEFGVSRERVLDPLSGAAFDLRLLGYYPGARTKP